MNANVGNAPNVDSHSETLIEVIQRIVSTQSQSDGTLVLRYRNEFQALWSPEFECPPSVRRLILIDDGIPRFANCSTRRSPDFSKLLHAVSWAAYFIASRAELEAPEILVLNLNQHKPCWPHDNDNLFSIELFSMLPDELLTFALRLKKVPEKRTINESAKQELAKLWLKHWRRQEAVSSEDGHSIANDVAPMLLHAGLSNEERSRVKWERYERLSESELAAYRMFETLVPLWFEAKEQKRRTPSSVTAMLVDDRHEQFKPILEAVLGSAVRLQSDKSIALEIGLEEDFKVFGRSLREKLTIDLDDDLAFLVLDLRLWRDNTEKEELLSSYVTTAHRLLKNNLYDEPDTSKLEEAMQFAQNLESHRSLALLPLLLSTLDPSLPIILFSSSQHRSVVDLIRDRPNIISTFSKPYPGGDDPDTLNPYLAISTFRAAVSRALHLQCARKVWRYAAIGLPTPEFDETNNLVPLQFKWGATWPASYISEKTDHPLYWLRNVWLPLAQEKHFELACAAFWHYLSRVFGVMPLQIVLSAGSEYEKERLERMRKASGAPLLRLKTDHERSQDVFKDIAEIIGVDFVDLLKRWQERAKGQNDQETSETAGICKK